MKNIYIAFFVLFILANGFSQHRGRRGGKTASLKGHISGIVIDSVTREPIEYAIVELLNKSNDKQVNGIITDENGRFKLVDIKTGKYKLKVSFIGYTPKILTEVELTLSKPDKNLKNILLAQADHLLDEIQIVDQRSLVESKVDKLVYNVAKDPTLEGGDATDVLRKVPMLSVDMDGNVSLRGSNKVKILLNGKPSGLFSSDVGEALEMFPADEIKKVEVITSPSAKYDGEGSAGIINIITKKGIVKGMKGSIKTFLGNQMEHLRGSIAIGRGRFGMNARLGFRHKLPRESIEEFYRKSTANDNILELKQDGLLDVSRSGFGGVIGAFYDFNAYNSINTSVRLRGYNYNSEGKYLTKTLLNDLEQDNYSREEKWEKLRSAYSWNADYTRKFSSSKDKKLVLAFQLEGNLNKNNNEKSLSNLEIIENNDNQGTNKELTSQLDFVQPLGEAVKFETGAKSILRKLSSDFRRKLYLLDAEKDSIDLANSDIFNYNQNVYAGYISGVFKLPHSFGLIAGLRYELTAISGLFDEAGLNFNHDYDNWLPSMTISKRFKDFSTIKLSYNERIHRPSLRHINPFIDNRDPLNISYGNPKLSPELTRQIEMSYSKFLKGSMVNVSLFYKRTKDVINTFLRVDSNAVSRTSYYNIGRAKSYGINIFTSLKLFKIWELRGNFNVNRYIIQGSRVRKGLKNRSIKYNAFLSSTLSFAKTWKAEIWGFFNSPNYTLQGKNPSFSMYSFGIQKELLNKKGKIGLRLVDPFNADKIFLTELKGKTFYQKRQLSVPFRSIGLTFSYSFGKLNFKSRKSAIRNDDLKSGGGGEEEEGDR